MADDKAQAAAEKEKPADKTPEKGEDGKTAEGGEAAAEGSGKSKKKLIIFGGVGFAVVVIVGALAWFFLGGKGEDKPHVETLAGVVYVEVPPMTMNMMSDGGGEHFLKAKVMLEVASEEDKAKVLAQMPKLQDDWNGFLRQMRPEDVQGSGAIQRLKEGMLLRANQALAPVPVKQVLLTELVIQ